MQQASSVRKCFCPQIHGFPSETHHSNSNYWRFIENLVIVIHSNCITLSIFQMLNPSIHHFLSRKISTQLINHTHPPCTSSFAKHLGPATAGNKGLKRLGRRMGLAPWFGKTKSSASTVCVNVQNYVLQTGDPALCTSNQLGKTQQKQPFCQFNHECAIWLESSAKEKNSKNSLLKPSLSQRSGLARISMETVKARWCCDSRRCSSKVSEIQPILGDSNGWIPHIPPYPLMAGTSQ